MKAIRTTVFHKKTEDGYREFLTEEDGEYDVDELPDSGWYTETMFVYWDWSATQEPSVIVD
jgi:hypothetical protein